MYLTIDEINDFLGTSGEDALLTTIEDMVSSSFNSMLSITSLEEQNFTEYHEANKGIIDRTDYEFYILKELNPSALVSINDVAVTGDDYLIEGRLLKLDYQYSVDKWNRVKFIYTAGYSTIPSDIKLLLLTMIGGVYNQRKGLGITEWSQGQLTVKFATTEAKTNFIEMLQAVKSKYKKNTIYTTKC